MATLTLRLEPRPGALIEATAAEMQRVSDAMGVIVAVKFNDVACNAYPGGSAENLVANFHGVVVTKSAYKFAPSSRLMAGAKGGGSSE